MNAGKGKRITNCDADLDETLDEVLADEEAVGRAAARALERRELVAERGDLGLQGRDGLCGLHPRRCRE